MVQVYQRQLSKQGLQSIVVDEKEQANALSRCRAVRERCIRRRRLLASLIVTF